MIRNDNRTGSALELYVHIPFCIRKCAYCDFLSAPGDDAVIGQYVRALQSEIEKKAVAMRGREVISVFFGGGTPTVLSGEQIRDLMDSVCRSFSIVPDAEISMECNPKTVTNKKLSAMREAGINRLSIGLQSAQDDELATLGRIHKKNDFLNCYAMARDAGFHNINVDLIYGVPGQTRESFSSTLHQVCSLLPEHLSVYRLIIEPGTPFYSRYHEDELKREKGKAPVLLPSEEEEAGMEAALNEILPSFGYERYEISNYARQGKECRHNIGYWTGVSYLGLGLGAASYMYPDRRYSNTSILQGYLEGNLELKEEVVLTKNMQMEEFMFLGLRMLCGIKKSDFYERFKRPVEQVYGEQLERLSEQGLLEVTRERIFLTGYGMLLGNVVFASFLL